MAINWLYLLDSQVITWINYNSVEVGEKDKVDLEPFKQLFGKNDYANR